MVCGVNAFWCLQEPLTCGRSNAAGDNFVCNQGFRFNTASVNETGPTNGKCCSWISTCQNVIGPGEAAFICPEEERLVANATNVTTVSAATCCVSIYTSESETSILSRMLVLTHLSCSMHICQIVVVITQVITILHLPTITYISVNMHNAVFHVGLSVTVCTSSHSLTVEVTWLTSYCFHHISMLCIISL